MTPFERGRSDAMRGHTACPFADPYDTRRWELGYDKERKATPGLPRFGNLHSKRAKPQIDMGSAPIVPRGALFQQVCDHLAVEPKPMSKNTGPAKRKAKAAPKPSRTTELRARQGSLL